MRLQKGRIAKALSRTGRDRNSQKGTTACGLPVTRICYSPLGCPANLLGTDQRQDEIRS